MEHPPKQGLKLSETKCSTVPAQNVLMEHPPKQGLKHQRIWCVLGIDLSFNGTSTKTRIET